MVKREYLFYLDIHFGYRVATLIGWSVRGLTGHQYNRCRGSVGLGEAPQALAKLVVSSILGCSVDVCNSNLSKSLHTDSDQKYSTLLRIGESNWYLAVVELLDDSFTLLADVANTDKFCLTVTLKEPAAYSLNHNGSRTSARYTAVLNVPKDTDWRNVFRTVVLWRPWSRHSTWS